MVNSSLESALNGNVKTGEGILTLPLQNPILALALILSLFRKEKEEWKDEQETGRSVG